MPVGILDTVGGDLPLPVGGGAAVGVPPSDVDVTIDRLELDHDGELVVTDYKTGRAPGDAWARQRMTGVHVYSLMCERWFGRRPVRVHLLHLAEPVTIVAEPSEQSTRGLARPPTGGCARRSAGGRPSRCTRPDRRVRDEAASHDKFKAKYSLNFTLLSDPEKTAMEAYGAWGKGRFGKEGVLRKTFIINPEGQVVKEYGRVTPLGHGEQVIESEERVGEAAGKVPFEPVAAIMAGASLIPSPR